MLRWFLCVLVQVDHEDQVFIGFLKGDDMIRENYQENPLSFQHCCKGLTTIRYGNHVLLQLSYMIYGVGRQEKPVHMIHVVFDSCHRARGKGKNNGLHSQG